MEEKELFEKAVFNMSEMNAKMDKLILLMREMLNKLEGK